MDEYLVDYDAYAAQMKFQRKGIKGIDLTEEEKESLRERGIDPEEINYEGTNAVITRTCQLNWEDHLKSWQDRAQLRLKKHKIPSSGKLTRSIVLELRRWCNDREEFPITKAYGGHYFSPQQAMWIDALREALPQTDPQRTVALAALIHAASKCAAAPGHTTQPFQPTRGGKKFLEEAWAKDIVIHTKEAFVSLASLFARKKGHCVVADANQVAQHLKSRDLVFIDPPYSGVHYSRFYHVLETIATGECGEVSGVGWYPPNEFRPRSKYSVRSQSTAAIDELLRITVGRGARAILTYPVHECSNGLSGKVVCRLAEEYFYVEKHVVESKFSTLGGNGKRSKDGVTRKARQQAREIILLLKPR